MTAADIAETSGGSRKIKWLAIAVIMFVALYSGGWLLAANQIETQLPDMLDLHKGTGASAECSDMRVRGFPFRIGVFCDTVRIDDARRGASATFGALRSAAQVYQPGHAVMELDGPAEIRVAPGFSVSAEWSLLKASLRATLSGLDRTSMTYDRLSGSAVVPALGEDSMAGATHTLAFSADHGEAHFRQNGEDLDAALSVDGFAVKAAGGAGLLPPVSASTDLTFVGRASLMNSGGLRPGALRSSTGEMRSLTLDLGSDMVTTASGPFSVDDQGLISGEFSVTMKNIEGWRQHLVRIFPDKHGTAMVNNIANMLTALSDGKNEATVKLNVRDGVAFLAFFPIGELPHL